ncbi:MAG: glutamyl-tRNA reductase [Planctomycetota bacterium]|nr:MAG: glutamyl-tRNA reductase [Planctomycetota bacterium]
MDRIALAGLTIHGADVAALERVRRPSPERWVAWLRELSDELGASELVFLATCNRVEVIYAREEGELPSEDDLAPLARHLAGLTGGARECPPDQQQEVDALRDSLLLRTGRDAVSHLFRVAASLDSLVLGEDQIIAQVREAYATSADHGLTGTLLGPLFHHALAIGKKVRADTDLARHPVSLVNLAMAALDAEPEMSKRRVAVIGAGEMGALLARVLRAAGLGPHVIVNRSESSARLLASDCDALPISLEAFQQGAEPVDVILSATSAPGTILSAAQLQARGETTPSGHPLLGIDLAVPRDLESVQAQSDDHAVHNGSAAEDSSAASNSSAARADRTSPRVRVLDLDALRAEADANRALRAEAAALAEQLVERKVDTWARRFHEEAAAPVVSELQRSSGELLDRELQGLLGGRLAHLPEQDRRAVERWARATFGRLMHLPVTALKRMAHDLHNDPDDEPAGDHT